MEPNESILKNNSKYFKIHNLCYRQPSSIFGLVTKNLVMLLPMEQVYYLDQKMLTLLKYVQLLNLKKNRLLKVICHDRNAGVKTEPCLT